MLVSRIQLHNAVSACKDFYYTNKEQNVTIEFCDGYIALLASVHDTYVRIKVDECCGPSSFSHEPATVCLMNLREALDKCESSLIDISADDEFIIIKCGGELIDEVFICTPHNITDWSKCKISNHIMTTVKQLKEIKKKTWFATLKDFSGPDTLRYVYMFTENGILHSVATDQHVLVESMSSVKGQFAGLIHEATFKYIVKTLCNADLCAFDDVLIGNSENEDFIAISAKNVSFRIMCKHPVSKYPNYRRVKPCAAMKDKKRIVSKPFEVVSSCICDRKEMVDALMNAVMVNTGKYPQRVKLSNEGDGVTISSDNDGENNLIKRVGEFTTDNITLYLNGTLLAKLLRSLKSTDVMIKFYGADRGFEIYPMSKGKIYESYYGLQMPMLK